MLEHAELRRWLRYEPDTGFWFWVEHPIYGKAFAGRRTANRAGDAQYQTIMINRHVYKAHRLAWFYMTGRWPKLLDHKNRNRQDNRWCNLREATKRQNAGNTRIYKSSRSGLKGVAVQKGTGRFCAFITRDKKSNYLGTFTCPAAAHFAYLIEAHKHFGEFA